MKRIINQFTYPTILFIVVMFLAFMVLTSVPPARAASGETAVAGANTASKADRVEARIKELHTKLMITPEQEEAWNKVTQVMRENERTMEALIKTRSESGKTMNAVDDLKSYSGIADAHADGLKKFIPVFEPLYTGMSDAQKKNADALFHYRQPGRATHHKAKSK